MPRFRPLVGVTLLALFTFASPGAAQEKQKYLLKETCSAGDASVDENVNTLVLALRLEVPQGTQDVRLETRSRDQVRRRILGVDDTGNVSHQRLYFQTSRAYHVLPMQKPKDVVSPLQGKTVTLRRDGRKVTMAVDSGKIPQSERAALEVAMLSGVPQMFPPQEVGPGEEWQVQPEAMKQMFGPYGLTGSARCRFEEITTFEGRRCARIHMNVWADATAEPGINMTLTLAGDLHYALDLKRTLCVDLKGPVRAQGMIQALGAQISGDGSMTVKSTSQWLEIEGKPVEKPKTP